MSRRTTGCMSHELYATWHSMRERCRRTTLKTYARYGGRGITVCPEWDHFWTFVFDMAPRPPGTSLDRIDNNGPYAPWNCRWATSKVQQRNSRKCLKLTKDGETLSAPEWAERFGLSRPSIQRRIKTRGVEHALDGLPHVGKRKYWRKAKGALV